MESLPGDNEEFIKGVEGLFSEEHFKSMSQRCDTGRFIVQLPMKVKAELILDFSKENEVKRLN